MAGNANAAIVLCTSTTTPSSTADAARTAVADFVDTGLHL
jgi:hypothetical protein